MGMNKLMIREEFEWNEIHDYLKDNSTVVFVGPCRDERSTFFPDIFSKWDCSVVSISATNNFSKVNISIVKKGVSIWSRESDLITGIRHVIQKLYDDFNVVVMDISSLEHSVLMFLTSLLIKEFKPLKLFATYAEPEKYLISDTGEYKLSDEFLGLRAVPGFSRRLREIPITLTALLGFDSDRLMKIIEETQEIKSVIPVIGFPSFRPGWQMNSLKNSMRVIEYTVSHTAIHKCRADSVYDALELIRNLRPKSGEIYALAPLGTKPHSLACAIYATTHNDTLVFYDNPVESIARSSGIARCVCYHLTSLINP